MLSSNAGGCGLNLIGANRWLEEYTLIYAPFLESSNITAFKTFLLIVERILFSYSSKIAELMFLCLWDSLQAPLDKKKAFRLAREKLLKLLFAIILLVCSRFYFWFILNISMISLPVWSGRNRIRLKLFWNVFLVFK